VVHPDSISTNDEGQIFYFLFVKLTLFRLQVQSCIRQGFQHLLCLFLVFLQGVTGDHDVVDICGTEIVQIGS